MRAETELLQHHSLSEKVNTGIPRWADAMIAVAALVFAGPLIVVVGLAIAMTSGRPILFRQRRVGRNGQLFDLYKLRTMTAFANGPEITSRDDARITRLGRVLRKTKLDELPTLWNVLRGDMALVGPRPEVPAYVNLDNPQWSTILSVRPGITDPVTIALRNEEELLAAASGDAETYYVSELQPAKLRGYVDYLQHRTVLSDMSVLCRTVTAVIRL